MEFSEIYRNELNQIVLYVCKRIFKVKDEKIEIFKKIIFYMTAFYGKRFFLTFPENLEN
jgi:hypothetical protein